MNVLEDFWYGNLDPAEYDANPGKEYKELPMFIANWISSPRTRIPMRIFWPFFRAQNR